MRFSYILPSYSNGLKVLLYSISVADVKNPPFASVASILLASISATHASCPSPGLLPPLDSKFLVVCLMESPLFAGTSPAPKHGPQNAVFTFTPAVKNLVIIPFFARSMYMG